MVVAMWFCLSVNFYVSDGNKSCVTSLHRWVRAMNHSFTVCSGCWLRLQALTWWSYHLTWEKSKGGYHNGHVWNMHGQAQPPTHTHTHWEPVATIHQVGFSTRNKFLCHHLSWFFYEALRLHMRAVKLISPPTNPSILMLVHIGLGHSKPMINDVLIGLFSTTKPRCWVDSTLAYLSHPACQRRMFPAGK